jgi:PIN domain-containing protein
VPLEFLADRSIGKRVVASLRGAGELIHTLADVFGEEVSQGVEDDSWIAHAGSRGWAALTKDRRIRHVTVEREAVRYHDVVLFALPNANLGLDAMAGALVGAMPRIHEICAERPGGSIWVVQRDCRVEKVWPSIDDQDAVS